MPREKVLMLHIPRTGGTWVRKALAAANSIKATGYNNTKPGWIARKHSLLAHLNRKAMSVVEFVCGFVRHPISYYESLWFYITATNQESGMYKKLNRWRTWQPFTTATMLYNDLHIENGEEDLFNDWMFCMLEKEPLWYTRLIEQYVGPSGGEFLDYIGRTETLERDFCEAMTIFGYGEEIEEATTRISDIGKCNTSKERLAKKQVKEKKVEWCPDIKARVLETERQVIARFYEDNFDRRKYCKLLGDDRGKYVWFPV